ncbi:MAG: hypothetical protein KDH19_10495 [Geminicoccaceae bacterium]|nr:hypothetical protein [Geminicoccaceae bacterium]
MTTTRRTFTASMVATTMATPALAAESVDPHRAWLAAYIENERTMTATDEDDSTFEAITDEDTRLRNLIWRTPTNTIDGAKVQLELLIREKVSEFHGNPEDAAYRNVLATLESLS